MHGGDVQASRAASGRGDDAAAVRILDLRRRQRGRLAAPIGPRRQRPRRCLAMPLATDLGRRLGPGHGIERAAQHQDPGETHPGTPRTGSPAGGSGGAGGIRTLGWRFCRPPRCRFATAPCMHRAPAGASPRDPVPTTRGRHGDCRIACGRGTKDEGPGSVNLRALVRSGLTNAWSESETVGGPHLARAAGVRAAATTGARGRTDHASRCSAHAPSSSIELDLGPAARRWTRASGERSQVPLTGRSRAGYKTLVPRSIARARCRRRLQPGSGRAVTERRR